MHTPGLKLVTGRCHSNSASSADELERREVGLLVLESRTSDKNSKDVELLLSTRAKGMTSGIDLRHVRERDEPRLRVPDQLLGAYGDLLCGILCGSRGADRWRDELGAVAEHVTVIDVRP